MRLTDEQRKAIEQCRDEDGHVKPAVVVEHARDDQSPLHELFTWDDTEAAHNFRLMQARWVIRATVKILPRTQQVVRAYISLPADRKSGIGYRSHDEVMNNEVLRRQHAQLGYKALKQWQLAYGHHPEFKVMVACLARIDAVFGEGLGDAAAGD